MIDTNVALDWLLFCNPRVDRLVQALQAGALRWIMCAAMRDELARMLAHPRLRHWAPEMPAALARFDALTQPQPTPPPSRVLRCSDSDDQVFLDLALTHRARWLFTHDRALLKLAPRARRLGLALDITAPQHWPGT